MSDDYPDRVWVTAPPAPSVTSCPRDDAQEYIRADIARDAIRLVVSIAEGYGVDRAQLLQSMPTDGGDNPSHSTVDATVRRA